MQPQRPDQSGSESAFDDMRARRRRTARNGLSRIEVEAERKALARPSPTQAERWRGPKLNKVQREALITAVTLHEDGPADTIREVFAELCGDTTPEIADRTIRYYRAQIRGDLAAQAQAAREQALVAGLANKSSRVAELRRQFVKLTRLEADELAAPARVMLAREKRETLRHIALELGQLPSSAALTINAAAIAVTQTQAETENEQSRQDLKIMLETLIEDGVRERLALAGAQRPSERLSSM